MEISRLLRILIVVSLSAASAVLTSQPAHAATCVVPTPGTYDTIQSASNDPSCTTIKLKGLTFYENVTVVNPTTIVGAGGECGEKPRSVIDAQPNGFLGTGFTILAHGVTLKNLIVRHGGIGVYVDNADNFKAINLCVFGQRQFDVDPDDADGMRINGNDAVVKKSEFHSSDGSGLELQSGTGATITGNISRNEGRHCFETHIPNTLFMNNKALDCDDAGFALESAPNAVIAENVIGGTDDGVDAFDSGQTTVRANRIRNLAGEGVAIAGETIGPVVQENSVRAPNSNGIEVHCEDVCGAAKITGNTVSDARRDSNGFVLTSASTDGLVAANLSVNSGGSGFFLDDLNGWTIRDNVAVRSGRREDANQRNGFHLIDGSSNMVLRNRASGGRDDGFHLSNIGDYTLRGNVAQSNVKDGFHVASGLTNTLDQNKAIENQAEGIENDATDTLLTNNVAKGNRTDCNGIDGDENVTSSGNTCADGSTFNSAPPHGQVD